MRYLGRCCQEKVDLLVVAGGAAEVLPHSPSGEGQKKEQHTSNEHGQIVSHAIRPVPNPPESSHSTSPQSCYCSCVSMLLLLMYMASEFRSISGLLIAA